MEKTTRIKTKVRKPVVWSELDIWRNLFTTVVPNLLVEDLIAVKRRNKKMGRALKQNWIVEWSEAMNNISEAPAQYNIWAAISVIGSVLKNNVYFKRGTFTIYPNNYIVLVGPPGVGKGSSINPVYDLANSGSHKLVNLISDRITAPKIIERIASGQPGTPVMNGGVLSVPKDSTACLVSYELPTLIGGSDWMLPFLCEAWDRNSYDYDTKNSGTNVIKGMCTSLIGACVPEYIRRLNKGFGSKDSNGAINGGFTARTIFVYAQETSKKIIWPKPLDSTSTGKQLISNLKTDLDNIASLKGPFDFTYDGAKGLEIFYNSLRPLENDSDVVIHFKSRLLTHVIKVAMIFCAAERDDLKIDKIDVHNAVTCLKHVLYNLDKAFRGVGDSDIAESTARVQNFIEKRKFVTKNEILTNLHRNVSPESLDRILNVLCQIGFCRLKTIANGSSIKSFYEYIPPKVMTPQTSIGDIALHTQNGNKIP